MKELCGGIRILILFTAGNVECANTVSVHNQRDHAVGAHALLRETPLIRILLFLLKVPPKNGPLMMKHPPHTAFLRADLQTGLEVIGDEAALDRHKSKDLFVRQVQRQGCTVERHNAT